MMNNKRFVDNGSESIEDSGFKDILTGKNYYVDYFDEIVDLVNSLNDECILLAKQRDYWKKKYEEGTETFLLEEKLKDNLPLEQTLKIIGEL